MKSEYRPDRKAHVVVDDEGAVRQVLHSQELWSPEEQGDAWQTAVAYIRQHMPVLLIPEETVDRLGEQVSYTQPRDEGVSYRVEDEKRQFDATTFGFAQTCLNVPVWRAGLSVTVKGGPNRVVSSTDTSLRDVSVTLPPPAVIERWRELFEAAGTNRDRGDSEAHERVILGMLGVDNAPGFTLNRGRFFIYRYAAAEREQQVTDSQGRSAQPVLPLPPVPARIQDGRDYLVAELLFTLPTASFGRLNWRALVEVETNAVLYLRALVSGVSGLVFTSDPLTSTGTLTNTANQANTVLDPLRDDVVLPNLTAPVNGLQTLTGAFVRVSDDDIPVVAPPATPTGTDFDFPARTNDFAAVNAYYHADNLFMVIESLGFPVSAYFDGTSFPVHLDHRARATTADGIEINAFCSGDAEGDGIGLVGYCLGDLSDTANPLGRAVDKWVHWHEIGGHGILWDHVDSPNFGFAHSAGDGLAALQNDPESQLRGLPQRFVYAPFRAGLNRRFDRDVTAGWGWGGVNDLNDSFAQYQREQILATCHFRIYRALGGDAATVASRWHASRVVTYLILRAVGDLTPATNPPSALVWCQRLMATDLLDWTSEGLAGGAYNKVIRWAFEQQGLFQPPGAPSPVTTPGAPPEVDVYIDDGRGGEYDYEPVHWRNTAVWNRLAPDGGTTHENAVEGVTNFAYVKVRNRGTVPAAGVVVRGCHSLPGAGLTWPVDFTEMSPAGGITVPAIGPGSTDEVTVGPFAWTPNANAFGHDCLLMIASADGDPSNVDNFTAGETIAEWRLVPHDNNVAQRNVQPVPATGEALLGALRDRVLWAANPLPRPAVMLLEVQLPEVLRATGWRLGFAGVDGSFPLEPGEQRRLVLQLSPGRAFDPADIDAHDRDLSVTVLADAIPVGGMIYRLEADQRD